MISCLNKLIEQGERKNRGRRHDDGANYSSARESDSEGLNSNCCLFFKILLQ